MKRLVLITFLLLIYFNVLAPIKAAWLQYDPYMENIYKIHCTINDNIPKLKSGVKKTRSKVFKLVQPVLDIYLEEYKNNFIIGDSLSWAISCIFVSESSNKKGHSAKSSLWLKYNNPFGLTTGKKGKTVTLMSWEKVKGKRINMYRTFKTYSSLENAVESLMWDYLLKLRYTRLRESATVKEFLSDLYLAGYMTNPGWPNFAYNSIYLNSINKN